MRIFSFVASLFSFAFLLSCHSQSDLGYNLLPDDDKINPQIIDTFSIEVYTMPDDTISSNYVNTLLLGEYNDPIFGFSKAGFVSQFGLSESPGFSSSDIPDSVILTLTLDTNAVSYYGNTQTPQTFMIYRLPNSFNSDITYSSDQDTSFLASGDLLGSFTYNFSESVDTLHIPLDISLASVFFNADANFYSTTESFLDLFKGIYVSSHAPDGNGAIHKFKVSSHMAIWVYYHKNGTSEPQDPFIVTSNLSALKKFNLFHHDYSNTVFYDQIGDESSPQDSVAYIQAMGGLRVKIKIPHLEDLKALGEIAIYRAELIVKTAPSNLTLDSQYKPLRYMHLAGLGQESEFYLFPEYQSGTSYLPEAFENNEYRFDIASYVRDVLDGTIQNNGMWLFPFASSDNYTRSIITTGNHSNKMKLIFSYVKL